MRKSIELAKKIILPCWPIRGTFVHYAHVILCDVGLKLPLFKSLVTFFKEKKHLKPKLINYGEGFYR